MVDGQMGQTTGGVHPTITWPSLSAAAVTRAVFALGGLAHGRSDGVESTRMLTDRDDRTCVQRLQGKKTTLFALPQMYLHTGAPFLGTKEANIEVW